MEKRVIIKSKAFLWSTNKENEIAKRITMENPLLLGHITKQEAMELYENRLVVSELLYGDVVEVISTDKKFAKVVVPEQKSFQDEKGYPGYIALADLGPIPENYPETRKAGVISKTAELAFEAGISQEISFGTILRVGKENPYTYTVFTPHGKAEIPKISVMLHEEVSREAIVRNVIHSARKFLELPYVWAGTSAAGFDCSGFVYALFRTYGIWISRDAEEQSHEGNHVDYADAKPGDLLFFAYEEGKGAVHHVGLYLGSDQMIHSQTPGSKVIITKLSGTNYETELCTVARHF